MSFPALVTVIGVWNPTPMVVGSDVDEGRSAGLLNAWSCAFTGTGGSASREQAGVERDA